MEDVCFQDLPAQLPRPLLPDDRSVRLTSSSNPATSRPRRPAKLHLVGGALGTCPVCPALNPALPGMRKMIIRILSPVISGAPAGSRSPLAGPQVCGPRLRSGPRRRRLRPDGAAAAHRPAHGSTRRRGSAGVDGEGQPADRRRQLPESRDSGPRPASQGGNDAL